MATVKKTTTRKRRKPMTAEQKAAAAKRLAEAREKRLAENPPQYKSIHPDVLALDDEHPWHHLRVKEWIKTQKGLLASEKRNVKAKVKGAEAKVASIEGYIRNLDNYLKNGVYLDLFWGEFAEHKVMQVSLKKSYTSDGMVNRTYGVYYADINRVWGVDKEEVIE
jgi:hypothetical protein